MVSRRASIRIVLVGLAAIAARGPAACFGGASASASGSALQGAPAAGSFAGRVVDARVLIPGDETNTQCRTGVCKHNENTDLTRWRGAIYLVHRTAESQILGPNSSLRVYRSRDRGRSFELQAIIPAPLDRDIRDPHFYEVGGQLYIKALTRLPGFSTRDTGRDTIAVETHSTDGVSWTALRQIGPPTWGFWRVRKHRGVYYSAAYEDGDLRVALFRSTDGESWTQGPDVYAVPEDTPLETELVFGRAGRMLALVRMDGTDEEITGNRGRLRTKVCWSRPPYASFACPAELNGVRLDGPVAFFWKRRLFVVARKHLPGQAVQKRTALYEITGRLDGDPLGIVEWGELPSAGDTSYAGVVPVGRGRFLVTWYSGDIEDDPPWVFGLFARTDIWQATLKLSGLARRPPP